MRREQWLAGFSLCFLVACQGDDFVEVPATPSAGSGGGAGLSGSSGQSGAGPAGAPAGGQAGQAGTTQGGQAGAVPAGASGQAGGSGEGGAAGQGGSASGAGGSTAGASGATTGGQGGAGGAGASAGGGGTSGAPSGGQAGTGGVPSAGAGGAGNAGNAGMAGGPTGPTTYYVDADNGIDTQDGSLGAPFKTLQRGVQAAQMGDTVKVCAGMYTLDKTLTIPEGRTIKGGYTCGVFTPEPTPSLDTCASLGSTEVKGSASPLLAIEGQATLWNLTLKGSGNTVVEAVNAQLTLENSRVSFDNMGQNFTVAVLLSGPEKPVLKNNCILGGTGKFSGPVPASVGVSIIEGSTADLVGNRIEGGKGESGASDGSVGVHIRNASPELRKNIILGGEGISAASEHAGSIAIRVDSDNVLHTSPHIHDNVKINGGSGKGSATAPWGSVGVWLQCGVNCNLKMDEDLSLADNLDISGGKGIVQSPASALSAGLFVDSGVASKLPIVVRRNRIKATDPSTLKTTGFGARGVFLRTSRVRMERNMVLGNDGGTTSDSVGIEAIGLLDSVFENNAIHGGTSSSDYHYGLVMTGGQATLRHNTIIAAQEGVNGYGLDVRDESSNPLQGLTLENNLLLGSATPGTSGTNESRGVKIVTSQCIKQFPLFYAGNGFANYQAHGPSSSSFSYLASCEGKEDSGNESVGEFAAHNPPSSPVKGAVDIDLIATPCGAALHCRQLPGCDGETNCGAILFDPWTDDEANYSAGLQMSGAIVSLVGWTLNPSLSCLSQKTARIESVDLDLKGTQRPKLLVSRGSDEASTCSGTN